MLTVSPKRLSLVLVALATLGSTCPIGALEFLTFDDLELVLARSPNAGADEQLARVKSWYASQVAAKAPRVANIERFIKLLELRRDDLCSAANHRILTNLEFGHRESVWTLAAEGLGAGSPLYKRLVWHLVAEYNAACAQRVAAKLELQAGKLDPGAAKLIERFIDTIGERQRRMRQLRSYATNPTRVAKRESQLLRTEHRFDTKLRHACRGYMELMRDVVQPKFDLELSFARNLDPRVYEAQNVCRVCRILIHGGDLIV